MKLDDVEDIELVRRFNGGETACFDEIVRRYRPLAQSVALHRLRNASDAEEIANDTMVSAFKYLRAFRGDCALKTWLTTIATRLSLNRYWYNTRRKNHLKDSLDFEISEGATLADVIPGEEMSPAEEAELAELSSNVAAAQSRIDPAKAEIIRLRLVENKTYEEIAAHLNINVGTVKSRLARARHVLRAKAMEPAA